jgi:phosphatidylserine/phosphatidylglycerophosphate/cardiolipin synthase-like enzyme
LKTGFAIARRTLGDAARESLEIAERIALVALAGAERSAPTLSEVHFSPGSACRDRVVALLDQTRRTADLCMYTLTDDRIAEVVRRIHDRGVRVRIVSEEDKALDPGSDILDLRRDGIEVRFEATPALMHHKFAVLDGWIVVTGSYNWTRSAGSDNHENIIVSSDPAFVAPFAERFGQLWRRFGGGDA